VPPQLARAEGEDASPDELAVQIWVRTRARAQGQGLAARGALNEEGDGVGSDGAPEPRAGSCGAGQRRREGCRSHDFLEDWSLEGGDRGERRR
jgi:hypothetical protein